jgi:hypothetical protein
MCHMPGNDTPTPIAIFTYNRPDHTRRLLDSLANCSRFETCPVYIFSDCYKDASQIENVLAVRQIIREFADKYNGRIIEASENLGLNTSIVRGISQVCKEYSRIIVLEDDLILHPRTLDFMIQALDRYESDPRIGHISGFSFPIRYHTQDDAILLPLFNSWGWATWAKSWNDFEWSLDKAIQEMRMDSALRKRMYPYYDMFIHFYLEKDMVWDLLWHWKLRSLNKVGVFPSNSLVWCSGFDATAIHTGSVPDGYQESFEKVMAVNLSETILFPEKIDADPQAVQALKKFLHSKYPHPLRMFYRRVRDTIKAKLKGQFH